MSVLDVVVFDWDGTLYDSTGPITLALQQAVADVGGARPSLEDARHVIGLDVMEALARVAPDVPVSRYQELGERYYHHYGHYLGRITLFDGIRELLAELKQRGFLLAVATGKSRRGLDEALTAADLNHVFDTTRTADQTAGKPDPLMLHEIMRELDVSPERMLMVGDTSYDLQLAHNAGCAAVGVSYGAHAVTDLQPWQPLHIAHSVAQLHAFLQSVQLGRAPV